jgi:hypothetical protein
MGLVEERFSEEAQRFVVEIGRSTSIFDQCKLRLVLSLSQKQQIVDEVFHAVDNCAEIALCIHGFGESGRTPLHFQPIYTLNIPGESTRIPTLSHPTILRYPCLHFEIESLFTVPHSPQSTKEQKRQFMRQEHLFYQLITRLALFELAFIGKAIFEFEFSHLQYDYGTGPASCSGVLSYKACNKIIIVLYAARAK